MASNSFWTATLLQKLPYDVLRDFSPISLVSRSPLILAVNPSLPVKSVRELIALAKRRPGELNYASSGTGGTTHLATELFKSMAGVNIVRISYSSVGATLNGVLSGEAPIIFESSNVLMEQIRSKRLRALAVTTPGLSALAPGVPTVASTGLEGYEAIQMNGILAAAKTPQAVIARLNVATVRIINQPDIREKLQSYGLEVVGSTPDQLTNAVKGEMTRLGKVIREANIKAD
jgi:tripartite-type tricarboxylate transporter receptor subunit TctC